MASTLIGIRPLPDYALVEIFDKGGHTLLVGGKEFYTLEDAHFDGDKQVHRTHPGIRPRWADVIALGAKAEQAGLRLGDRILCDTMKWSRGIAFQRSGFGTHMKFWRIHHEDILFILDEERDDRCLTRIAEYKTKLASARAQWGS